MVQLFPSSRVRFLAWLLAGLFVVPTAPAQDGAAFTLHPGEFVGPPLVGFGAQFNPYLYATPNFGADVNETNVKDLERKLLALRPQHVRIFFALEWWDGRRDGIAKDDRRIRDSFLRTAQLAQACGATINLTYWHGPWPDPAAQTARFADIVKELRDEHGLSSIRFVTLQNEPNLHQFDIAKLTAIYRGFDARARRIGLRDQLQLIGGDLVQNEQQRWFADLAKHQPFLDGYGVHVYWDYWDTAKLLRRVSEVPEIVAALPPRARKPIYVTEFGVRGKREKPGTEPGLYEPDGGVDKLTAGGLDELKGRVITDVPLQAMQVGWFMMEAINRGYAATVQWDAYTAWYDRYMHYGVIGGARDGWPLRPAYHVLRMFTHTTQPGWRAVRVEGKATDVLVVATRGPKGELTLYALNRTGGDDAGGAGGAGGRRDVTLRNLPPGATIKRMSWNDQGRGELTAGQPLTISANGSLRLTLAPQTLLALTVD